MFEILYYYIVLYIIIIYIYAKRFLCVKYIIVKKLTLVQHTLGLLMFSMLTSTDGPQQHTHIKFT